MRFSLLFFFFTVFIYSNEIKAKSEKEFRNIRIFKENKNVKEEENDEIISYFLKNIKAEKAAKSLNGILGVDIKFLNKEIIFIGKKSKIEKILKILKKIDRPEKLIEIKANIIDTSNNLFDRLGFNWKILAKKDKMSIDFLNNKISLGSILGFGGNFVGVDIDALKEKGDINLKQIPSINVLENSKGEIKIADEIILSYSKKEKPQTLEAGLIFKVEPSLIYKDDEEYIKIKIFSEISNFKSKTSKQKNVFETELILKNNSSIFLGGISKNNIRNSITKTPVLSDIPIFGIFFQSKNKIYEKRDMYIEIEARIHD